MKKIISYLTLFVLVITLAGCGSSDPIANLDDKIEKKESFIALVTSETCSACQAYKPIVDEFKKEQADASVLEISLDDIKDETIKSDFSIKYAVTGTPTTLFFKDGVLESSKSGSISKNELTEKYEEYVK
ncbi:thioredoxin family protein [Erysipelotrichaceae bacterium OttesenSCG-928-M19]|nr:thioredoxin family protein [Erysipelotrichaceae bacterium OttesenSCG-928-M19]